MTSDFRTFISAVTSEFGKTRDAVGADLPSRGQTVILQSDFRQGPDSDTLLSMLHDHIRDCSAVVCIIGKRSGAIPPKAAAERIAKLVPLPDGIAEASYTQWEFFFARHFKRRAYVYLARDDYTPDKGDPAGPDKLQAAFVKYLKDQGVHYTPFSNVDSSPGPY